MRSPVKPRVVVTKAVQRYQHHVGFALLHGKVRRVVYMDHRRHVLRQPDAAEDGRKNQAAQEPGSGSEVASKQRLGSHPIIKPHTRER